MDKCIFRMRCNMSLNPYCVRLSFPTGAGDHPMFTRSDARAGQMRAHELEQQRMAHELEQQRMAHEHGQQSPSNVVFVIDPQNDFSDEYEGIREHGSLPVTGSTADYSRIINFIKSNDIHEVHVSLDTHSLRHIAHPGLWQIYNGHGFEDATNENSQFLQLSVDEQRNIIGTSIDPERAPIHLIPRNYDVTEEEYNMLYDYVHDYIKFFYKDGNSHLQPPMIWPNHCIEGTKGHQIASELHIFLESWKRNGYDTGHSTKPRILTYHNKGRNNLVEMYSVFSADKPISPLETLKLRKFAYERRGKIDFQYNSTGHDHYASHSNNLNTDLNVPLIQHLLRNDNKVFFCGEARTHCVKASIIDVMKVVQASGGMYNPANVALLKNMSSRIEHFADDIDQIMLRNRFSVFSPEEGQRIV